MTSYIKLYKKLLFGNIFIGYMRDPEFIIPNKGDIINITDEQIGVWNSEFSGKNLKVHHIHYMYDKPNGGDSFCEISIFVK